MAIGPAARNEKIFVNYRRDDARGFAGRLSDSLCTYFGKDRVFRDVTGIEFGHDFERVIDEKLSESGALVVMIGDSWTNCTDADGKRRLEDPDDYVVREIAAALHADVPVVPVLIGNAQMPRASELPETIVGLARRNAITLTDERWDHDVDRLAKVLAIDVPGTVAQRRLDWIKAAAILLLLVSGALATLAFCSTLFTVLSASGGGLREAGFPPIVSAIPFMAVAFAGALALFAAPSIAGRRKYYAWGAVGLAIVATTGTFVNYAMRNVADPDGSLVMNFGVGVLAIFGMLTLIALAGFRSE